MFENREKAERYFRSLLGILPDDPEKPLIILEGPSDKDALGGIMRGNRVSVVDTRQFPDPRNAIKNNKTAVIEIASWLKRETQRESFVGIVDADFERIEQLLEDPTDTSDSTEVEAGREEVHVFTTDYHDLDVHVVCETIMDFMKLKLRGRSYTDFVRTLTDHRSNYHNALWRMIVNAAVEIGLVRLALHRSYVSQKHIGKNLSSTKYIDSSLEIDVDGALKDMTSMQKNPAQLKQVYLSIRDRLRENLSLSRDDWKALVNGHDLLRILGICILACQGNRAYGFAEYGAPKEMRRMYHVEHFERTRMCQRIRNWAEGKMRLFYSS